MNIRDHLGSVDAITDDQGNVIQTMSFDAFGLRRDATNWDYDLSQNTLATLKNYTDRGYTDEEELDNVSLVDLNGRVYDPAVGRMISADPAVPDAFFSQAFKRFVYVYDSPLEYTDPSGYDKLAVIVVDCNWWCQYLALMQGSNMFAAYWYYQLVSSPPVVPPWVGGHGGPGSHGSAKPPTNATQPQQPKPQTTKCVVEGKSTGNGNNGVQGALPGVTVQPGNVAIDPAVLGLPAGVPSTNQMLANYASQITISFSPPPPLPPGFPTTFTVGDIVGPASARGQNPPIFDINGLPDLQSQYNVTGIRQVTIAFPSSAPFTCSGS